MTQAMRAMLRGLVILFAVACLLRGADAKSCKDDLDCPLKQCCTGNSSRAGVCSPLFVNGKQVCPSCKGFPGRQLACPAGTSVCCDDGTCRKKASDCKCSFDGQCPLRTCCTGTYEKPGYCSPQAYVNGTYVCKDCQSRAGLYGGGPTSCPPDASVCCADGTCAKTATECKCNDIFNCPFGFCCSGNYTNPGLCVTQRMVNGKQTCPNCQGSQRNGAACPKEASLCCNDGTCQKTIEGCTCSYSTDCDATACCTGNYTTPGKCSTSPFVGGKQVCGDCTQFVAGFTSCPAKKSVCCVDGSCQASLSLCTCTSNSGCSGKSCCTGTLAKPGHCTPSPYVNGTQVCPDCHEAFTGFSSCPPGRSVCCLDGSCQQNLGGCGCRTQGECPDGYCCNGDQAKPGKCVAQAFVSDKQVCKGCDAFKGRRLSCPKTSKYCCKVAKSCSATLAGCPCFFNSDCPLGSCCTGNSSFAGVCTATPFKNGKQVCPQCGDLGDQNMACPASASVCCADGSCKASLAGCACKENYDCPTSTCCTATNGTLGGHCSASIFVKGKQVCPKCNAYDNGDLACPPDAQFCCPDGSCKRHAALCQCSSTTDCPLKTCCSGFSHGKKGTCAPQPFVNGTQTCPDCGLFLNQGLSCPPQASFCCADGTCKASEDACKCTSDGDCSYGSCCTGKGTCSRFSFIKGLQVCTNCTSFISREVNCPATARQCCTDGLCKAKC